MKLRRIMALVLCFAMVLSTLSFTAFATEATDVDVWDGNVDTSWYDAENPQTEYTLTTAEQFAGLAYLVNGAQTYNPVLDNADTADFGYYCEKIAAPTENADSVDFEGVTIKLAADLDLRAVYADGDPVLLPGNEYLTMMPIGYSIYTPFKGTFDGQGHTIKNVFQGMWDALGHPSGSYEPYIALGVFGNVENATIKNLVIDNISFNAEAVLGGVVGQVKGTSVFDTITVKNSIISSSGGWRAGGLIGDAEGELTIKNINIDETNTVAQSGGNYDTAVGGIVAKYSDGGSIAFENCDVACKLDVYNDVVANYKTHVYRNCGMIIGAIGEENEIEIDGKLYPDFDAKGLTFDNVKATFGDWANYTYCWSDEVSKGCQRIEPGVGYNGVDVSNLNEYSVERVIFDALFGAENAGDLSNVRGRVDIEIAESLGVTGIEAEEYQLLGGKGTETDPYLINNLEDLKKFRDDVNIGNTYEGKYVLLTADIDLSGEVWTPIGTSVYSKEPTDDDIKMFAGNFDGGNHTITGLTSEGYVPDSDETEDNEYSFGLFGCVYGSNISNINLEGVDVDGTTRENSDGNNVDGSGVAALVGYYMPVDGKTSIIENCHVLSGTVKASNNMGGLIGFIDSNFRMPEVDITIKDCSNAADVTTDAREAGGVVGLIRSSRTDIEHISMRGNILFENCENSGDITSLGGGNPSAGGILGRDGNEDSWAKLNMVFDGCKNTGKITVYANNETHAAGIAAGHYSNGAWFVIKDSSNSGEVVVVNPENAGDVYAGGLISYGGVIELLNSTSSKAVKLGTVDGNTFIGDVANILFIDEMYGYADTVNGCTYFLNGGDAPDERKYLTDDSGNYNFYPVETASKDGFEFGYWYDNPEFTGNVYDATTTIRNGGVKVFYAKWIGPVATIEREGEVVEYNSLNEAFADALEGETITLLDDAVPALTSQRAITKASVIDLNGKTLTLTEDDLYFGTTTFKNGKIVVAPSVKASTGVFWMFENQTLTFDDVEITATGVTGTYLIGINGGTGSAVNLLNGSSIAIDNVSVASLTAVICDNGTGNTVTIDDADIDVKNIEGRFYLGGTNGTISVNNSDIDLNGVKEGFYLRAGQLLSIEGTSTVDVVLNDTQGRWGINVTDATAFYSKADTATVNANDNMPDYIAKIGDTYYSDLHEAMVACKVGETVLLIADVDLAGIEWEPVSFKGIFDGQDHIISNLTINKPGVSNTGFITSLNGTFKNVTFTNPTVTGGENTGVVAGRAGGSSTLAENITVNGTIKVETTHSGYARAGVIVGGWAYGNYKNITVDGGDKAVSYIKHTGGGDGRYVAGIVGHADDVESYVNCAVKNITISSTNDGWLCGGIAGPGPAAGLASGCTVENVNIGADYSGGLFGWYYGDGTIENSTIKDIAFTAGTTKNGAIGGYNRNPDATVTNVTIENVTNGDAALLEHVVKVNDTYYFDFEDAIKDAIEAGGDITLLADIEPSETIKVTNNITLDLNGKTISGTCNAGQAHLFMVNNGTTMTIKDSSTAQTGKITYAGDNSTGWIIDVEGNLVLESGTLELTGTWGIGYAVDVRPNAWGTAYTDETAFVMNGGKIISSDGAVRVASSSSDTYKNVSASFTMNGGEIEAAWDGVFVQQSNAAWDVLNVTINDGTIKSGLNPIRFYGPAATSYVNGEDCVDIELNGGTLNYTGTEAQEWLIDGILRLGGGVTAADFMKDCDVTASASFASANVADGYFWVSIGRKYRLQTLGEYSFVVGANPDEIIDSGSFTVTVKVASQKVDDFYSAEYIITYDTTLLTCAEDNGTFDYDTTLGTLRLQYFGEDNKNDVNEVMSTLNFTTKDFYLTQETEITVTGTVCATQYDAAVGTSEPVADGAVVVLLKDSFTVTVGAGLEGDAIAYNKTDYIISVAAENQGKQNTVKYTIKDADGNPIEYSVILPAGTNEYTISGDAIIGDMTFEIADAYSIEIITDYVTGYALILVDGTADGYTYNGYQMFKINRSSGTFDYNGRYGWLVDGTAPGTTLESVEAAAYAAIRTGGESKAVETGYDVNSYINGDGKINFYDVSAVYACQKVDFALSEIDDYFYMELYLASDTNCDGKVDSSDSAVISVNYN